MTLAQQMIEDSRLQSQGTAAPPIKAADLISLFRQARAEEWGYIWGTRGQTWTQANQDAATREKTVQYGQKWVGRKVADCSGLFVWAYKKLGASIYHGSNTIWKEYTSMTGAVGGDLAIRPGTAVFMVNDGRRTHIGLYVGEGKHGAATVIEAQGTQSGVVESDLSRWDEWGMLTDVDYTGVAANVVEIAMPVLRKGSNGAAVETLQERLISAGYDVGEKGADGKFGSETLSAVRAFQADNNLTPDGIVGPLTWAALEPTEDDEDGEDKPADAPTEGPEEPTETTDAWATLSIEEKVENLNERLKRQEGGESDV